MGECGSRILISYQNIHVFIHILLALTISLEGHICSLIRPVFLPSASGELTDRCIIWALVQADQSLSFQR